MKALGITLLNNLSWEQHLSNIIPKSQTKLSLLKKIRPYITLEQFLTIATSQIFSTTYYASAVWLNCTLTHKLKKRIDSFHYRVIRVACNNFKGNKNVVILHLGIDGHKDDKG